MDDYTREMMDLKTLVTRTLEKKGVLAKIRVWINPLLLSSLMHFHSFLNSLINLTSKCSQIRYLLASFYVLFFLGKAWNNRGSCNLTIFGFYFVGVEIGVWIVNFLSFLVRKLKNRNFRSSCFFVVFHLHRREFTPSTDIENSISYDG